MSGSFNDIDVPPTLVSFAVDVASYQDVVTPELKKAGNQLVCFDIKHDAYDKPDYQDAMDKYEKLHQAITEGKVVSAYAIGFGGMIEAISKMAFGNKLGVKLAKTVDADDLTAKKYGSIILEVEKDNVTELGIPCTVIGEVQDAPEFVYGDTVITMDEALDAWTKKLEKVFPTESGVEQNDKINDTLKIVDGKVSTGLYDAGSIYVAKNKVAKPKVFIPVFPGTNCEYDSTKAFERAGAKVVTKVFRNLTAEDIRDSVTEFEKAIDQAQIIMFPGGFSAGDEPDGSAKLITAFFRNPEVRDATMDLLKNRDGLMLGICNGFQALIKLGLVPYGEIIDADENCPTLTFNTIGRHQSRLVRTRIASNRSPWLAGTQLGDIYTVPVSHGEGRFLCSEELVRKLAANGQIATQYVDENGVPGMDVDMNPNGSIWAVEGIMSPDGRVLGKMGHSERVADGLYKNMDGRYDMKLFQSAKEYFNI